MDEDSIRTNVEIIKTVEGESDLRDGIKPAPINLSADEPQNKETKFKWQDACGIVGLLLAIGGMGDMPISLRLACFALSAICFTLSFLDHKNWLPIARILLSLVVVGLMAYLSVEAWKRSAEQKSGEPMRSVEIENKENLPVPLKMPLKTDPLSSLRSELSSLSSQILEYEFSNREDADQRSQNLDYVRAHPNMEDKEAAQKTINYNKDMLDKGNKQFDTTYGPRIADILSQLESHRIPKADALKYYQTDDHFALGFYLQQAVNRLGRGENIERVLTPQMSRYFTLTLKKFPKTPNDSNSFDFIINLYAPPECTECLKFAEQVRLAAQNAKWNTNSHVEPIPKSMGSVQGIISAGIFDGYEPAVASCEVSTGCCPFDRER